MNLNITSTSHQIPLIAIPQPQRPRPPPLIPSPDDTPPRPVSAINLAPNSPLGAPAMDVPGQTTRTLISTNSSNSNTTVSSSSEHAAPLQILGDVAAAKPKHDAVSTAVGPKVLDRDDSASVSSSNSSNVEQFLLKVSKSYKEAAKRKLPGTNKLFYAPSILCGHSVDDTLWSLCPFSISLGVTV